MGLAFHGVSHGKVTVRTVVLIAMHSKADQMARMGQADMRLLLADDHDLVRETLAAFLLAEGFGEVSCVATLPEAVAVLKAGPRFDLVLLDYSMPGMNGLEGLARAREAAPGVPVAIITGTVQRDLAEAALAAGAAGFIPKTLASRAMIAAVQLMTSGDVFAPISLLMQEPEMALALQTLTRRETDVLRGICEGKSNKEIARDLDLQEVTVKLHVKTLSRKLGAKNRTHAAMIARDAGMS
jgi:DNA-binding NarL/FixJ family response regulator